jgi:hypothetical protein
MSFQSNTALVFQLTTNTVTIVTAQAVSPMATFGHKEPVIPVMLLTSENFASRAQLLFLDEATSGLDSFRAESLVRSLRAYAHGPGERLVVLTVHQPSPTIFAALDGVICLLAGRLAFHGAPTDVLPFFSARGHSAPMDVSAPEHMLAVINAPEVAALVAAGDWLPVPDKAVAEGAVVPDKETAGGESVMQRPKPHTLTREAWLIWSR